MRVIKLVMQDRVLKKLLIILYVILSTFPTHEAIELIKLQDASQEIQFAHTKYSITSKGG